jgi:hypothetical protein
MDADSSSREEVYFPSIVLSATIFADVIRIKKCFDVKDGNCRAFKNSLCRHIVV